MFSKTIEVQISVAANKYLFNATGTGLEEIFDGNKLIRYNLSDSTYRVYTDTKNSIYNSKLVSSIVTTLEDDLKNHFLIKQQKDSLINGKSYYQVRITERDSVVNNKRTFRLVTVLIDKSTHLLYSYKSDQQGFIDGTNIFIKVFSEYHFKDYKVNSKEFAALSPIQIPPYFSLEKPKVSLPQLVKGTKAPEIELFDLIGNPFKLENQKGKIVLLNFTLNGCPHCVESAEMLNKLYAKYSNSDFVIVTINPFDSKESIQKNNARFNIKYSAFKNPVDGKKNIDNYHVVGYPSFYLIDKQGNIARGFTGYYPSLEKELTESISKLE